jgi:hypothetical protein
VVDLGARVSKGRTKFDNDTAFFWALGAGLGGGSSSVSGLWLEIAQRVSAAPCRPSCDALSPAKRDGGGLRRLLAALLHIKN